MKTLFAALLASTVLANSAHAYPHFGRWEKIAALYEEAHGEEMFRELQKKHPKPFEGMDPKKIASASISMATMRYFGQTICPANDPRLTVVTTAVSACLKGDSGFGGTCFKSSIPMLDPRDPCAEETEK